MDTGDGVGAHRPAACLCVLCGLPAAGKSTLARTVCSLAAQHGWSSTVLPYDDLIPEHAFQLKLVEDGDDKQQQTTEWKLHRLAVLQCIEQFLEKRQAPTEPPATGCQINSAVWGRCIQPLLEPKTVDHSKADHSPLLILLDDNFYYPSMRYEVYQLARKCSLGFCQVYLHCAMELCISRNQSRSKPLPTEVILEMTKRLESPNPQKNPWEKQSITLNSTDSLSKWDIQRLMELISSALSNPLSPVEDDAEQKEADRIKCATSVVHQADQACRRLVSEAMKSARENKVDPKHMRSLAAELNESKTRFLHNLRKQFLQELPIAQGEDIDVEHVVKTAVEVFNQDKNKILKSFIADHA
ncbi:L-seryl-tRNA(Sec) kinase [Myripristis murdjan]|uniref:Phosphoseryl-tRNA kinase n=1 Tax=Myripristis murdjan TaxID=586833 RepID=A0A667XCZ8_9TELE|nr:L-seryl-tRNA(Sec) kinase [Myripristis murdjan]